MPITYFAGYILVKPPLVPMMKANIPLSSLKYTSSLKQKHEKY